MVVVASKMFTRPGWEQCDGNWRGGRRSKQGISDWWDGSRFNAKIAVDSDDGRVSK